MHKSRNLSSVIAFVALSVVLARPASATYWNVFNLELESGSTATVVTYDTLSDMTHDTNRTGSYTPNGNNGNGNLVDSDSDGKIYWNLYNQQDDTNRNAQYIVYDTLDDMLHDTNRKDVYIPDYFAQGRRVVGSGSDGTTYWNLLNTELESDQYVEFVLFTSAIDMFNDQYGLRERIPFNKNIVDTGSDGTTYWNLFNVETSASGNAAFQTYATQSAMFFDGTATNDGGTPNGGGEAFKIVGTGSDSMAPPVPLPAGLWLLLSGVGSVAAIARRRSFSRT